MLGDLGLLTKDEVSELDREYSASYQAIEVSMTDMQVKIGGVYDAFRPWKPWVYLAAAISNMAFRRPSHLGYRDAIMAAFERADHG
jgi:hypothetical protein